MKILPLKFEVFKNISSAYDFSLNFSFNAHTYLIPTLKITPHL